MGQLNRFDDVLLGATGLGIFCIFVCYLLSQSGVLARSYASIIKDVLTVQAALSTSAKCCPFLIGGNRILSKFERFPADFP